MFDESGIMFVIVLVGFCICLELQRIRRVLERMTQGGGNGPQNR